jgi:photosystem II stability/assembly factor-like uncharacterized protein
MLIRNVMRVFLLLPLIATTLAAAQTSAPVQTPSSPVAPTTPAVWQLQDSGSAASLRGIHAVSNEVAWASGSEGTILRTLDGGQHWQRCTTPDAAKDGATLDFRGIQAFDATTAIAMSSGPGNKSRLYKTTDGCKSWTLSTQADSKDSFWDAVAFQQKDFGFAIGSKDTAVLIGDPVKGRFETEVMLLGHGWFLDDAGCAAPADQAAFAASNSSVFIFGSRRYLIGAGGRSGASVFISPLLLTGVGTDPCRKVPVPMAGGNESSGIFSLYFSDLKRGVAVGGDYTKPQESAGTAAYSLDGGQHWTAATKPPHGYRSTVQWSEDPKAWITAGTNGSDLSRDDGRTWQPLDNGDWNALSLPFLVGPKGRIARLNPTAVPAN